MKTCTNCKLEKDDINFYKNGKNLMSNCKDCVKAKEKFRRDNWSNDRVLSEKSRRTQYHLDNRDALIERSKQWVTNNPEKHKSNLLKRFNISLEQYNQLLLEQNNKCAICNLEEIAINISSNKVQMLSVDHCHITNKVRGLLCSRCNLTIGRFEDKEDLLESALKYLRKSKS